MHASLGLIGRAQTVESDELPMDDNLSTCQNSNNLHSDEFKSLIESLEDKAISLHFYRHSFLKCKLHESKFHGSHRSFIQNNVNRLFRLHNSFQELQLAVNIVNRLQEFTDLSLYIKRLIVNEQQTLQNHRQNTNTCSTTNCRLECLRAVCENLRICFNNISSMSSYVQSNGTVQRFLHKYRRYLENYIRRFQISTTEIIRMSQEFVSNGLLVLSHSDLSRFTHDDLWEIARGIEEYNIIIDHTLFQKRLRLIRHLYLETSTAAVCLNSVNRVIDQRIFGIRLMSFSRILFRLASERSLLIAHSVHSYFYQSDFFIDELKSFLSKPIKRKNNRKLLINEIEKLFNFDECLSKYVQIGSPVNDYLRLEYEFTSNFLDIISQSTEMLKELSTTLTKRKLHKEDTVENFMTPINSLDSSPGAVGNYSFLTPNRASKVRKGVQWSDHKDVSLRHQVIGQYLNVVWRLVNNFLINAKYSDQNWTSFGEDTKNMGSWMLMNWDCRQVVEQLIRRTATTEFFPAGFIPILQHQAELIDYEHTLLLWDQGMCCSLVLNSDMTSFHKIEDQVYSVSKQISDRLESSTSRFGVGNCKVLTEVNETIHPEQVDPNATLVTITLSAFTKYAEKLSAVAKSIIDRKHSGDIVQLLWPTLTEWLQLEIKFLTILKSHNSWSDDDCTLHCVQIPNVKCESKFCTIKNKLSRAFENYCCEKVNQMLDIGLMQKSTTFDTYNGASHAVPSAYAQGAVLAVLEPVYRSVESCSENCQYEALSVTIEIVANTWLKKLDSTSKNRISSDDQLLKDVSMLKEWILSKEALSLNLKAILMSTKSIRDLENYFSHLQPSLMNEKPSTDINFFQRQTSEVGQKVMQGYVRFCEEIRSKSNIPNDQITADNSLKSNISIGNLLTKSGQGYFRSLKSDK